MVKGLGGLYEVRLSDTGERITARAKGLLKRDEEKVRIGDNVTVTVDEDTPDYRVISEIGERKNSLIRPPMANLDYLFIVFAAAKPAPVTETVDKLISIAEYNGIEPVAVITKSDLDEAEAERLGEIYRLAGIPTFVTSSDTKEGVEALSRYVDGELKDGRTAAFAGASGVGKSTLMNSLFPNLALATAEISRKIERGKHTTRHVEIFDIKGNGETGFLADTPGFSLIDFERFDFFELDDLFSTFREFSAYLGKCRYSDCSHVAERAAECAVIKAVEEGRIARSRHESYKSICSVLKQKKSYN